MPQNCSSSNHSLRGCNACFKSWTKNNSPTIIVEHNKIEEEFQLAISCLFIYTFQSFKGKDSFDSRPTRSIVFQGNQKGIFVHPMTIFPRPRFRPLVLTEESFEN